MNNYQRYLMSTYICLSKTNWFKLFNFRYFRMTKYSIINYDLTVTQRLKFIKKSLKLNKDKKMYNNNLIILDNWDFIITVLSYYKGDIALSLYLSLLVIIAYYIIESDPDPEKTNVKTKKKKSIKIDRRV